MNLQQFQPYFFIGLQPPAVAYGVRGSETKDKSAERNGEPRCSRDPALGGQRREIAETLARVRCSRAVVHQPGGRYSTGIARGNGHKSSKWNFLFSRLPAFRSPASSLAMNLPLCHPPLKPPPPSHTHTHTYTSAHRLSCELASLRGAHERRNRRSTGSLPVPR